MTRARPFLPLPLLAIPVLALAVAACGTERKPLKGFDKPPAGGLVLDSNEGGSGGTVIIWTMFAVPAETQVFRPRLNGQDAVIVTSEEGFYDYASWMTYQGWTGGWSNWLNGIPPDTYVVEIVDGAGQSWGQSAPLFIPPGDGPYNSSVQSPALVFSHFDGQAGSWNIDPATQDADKATDEITVTNLVGEDVVVERCTIAAGERTSCTPIGTVAPQADLRTVETPVASSKDDYPGLFIHLASDASQSYQRDLVQGTANLGAPACQIERIFVHGTRSTPGFTPTGTPAFAMSTCYGYSSGPPVNAGGF
jgi:hypothetical protein